MIDDWLSRLSARDAGKCEYRIKAQCTTGQLTEGGGEIIKICNSDSKTTEITTQIADREWPKSAKRKKQYRDREIDGGGADFSNAPSPVIEESGA